LGDYKERQRLQFLIFPTGLFITRKKTNVEPKKSASRNLLTDIRKKLGKAKREWITLREFCEMTPFKTEDVIPYLE
jgi:hypothetical protein